MAKRVGLFGLSANPPTGCMLTHPIIGHSGIINALSSLFDEVWVLPVYKHIYSSKNHLISYEHRLNMCHLAFKKGINKDSIKISTAERDLREIKGSAAKIGKFNAKMIK